MPTSISDCILSRSCLIVVVVVDDDDDPSSTVHSPSMHESYKVVRGVVVVVCGRLRNRYQHCVVFIVVSYGSAVAICSGLEFKAFAMLFVPTQSTLALRRKVALRRLNKSTGFSRSMIRVGKMRNAT